MSAEELKNNVEKNITKCKFLNWNKNNHSMGMRLIQYHSITEQCIVYSVSQQRLMKHQQFSNCYLLTECRPKLEIFNISCFGPFKYSLAWIFTYSSVRRFNTLQHEGNAWQKLRSIINDLQKAPSHVLHTIGNVSSIDDINDFKFKVLKLHVTTQTKQWNDLWLSLNSLTWYFFK